MLQSKLSNNKLIPENKKLNIMLPSVRGLPLIFRKLEMVLI